MEINGVILITLGFVAFLIGFSKTAFPSLGILAVTIMALVFPAKDSVGIILPMLIMGDIFAVIYYRRKVIWKHLFSLVPWAILGLLFGYATLHVVESPFLQKMIGILVITLVMLQIVKERLNTAIEEAINRSRAFSASMGILAGYTTMIGNAAGGIMAIYLLSKKLNKTEFVGTGAWFFLFVNVLKAPFYGSLDMITWETFKLNLMVLPGIVLGALLGFRILRLVPEKWFQTIILALALIGGLRLLF